MASSTTVIGTISPRQWISSWIALWATWPRALAADQVKSSGAAHFASQVNTSPRSCLVTTTSRRAVGRRVGEAVGELGEAVTEVGAQLGDDGRVEDDRRPGAPEQIERALLHRRELGRHDRRSYGPAVSLPGDPPPLNAPTVETDVRAEERQRRRRTRRRAWTPACRRRGRRDPPGTAGSAARPGTTTPPAAAPPSCGRAAGRPECRLPPSARASPGSTSRRRRGGTASRRAARRTPRRSSGSPYSGRPQLGDEEPGEADHVEQRHGAQHGPAQVRPLGQGHADEQPAVRPAEDGQALAAGQPGVDEVVGGGVEVVEDVLLVAARSGDVPRLAVLVAAAQSGDGVEARRPRTTRRSAAATPGSA